MEAIKRNIEEGIAVEKINFVRATMNEASEIKTNLIQDSINYGKIIVDLSECDYIDSTFLGALVYSYKRIKERNGIIAFIIGDTQLSRSFIFEEFKKMFTIYRTLGEAIDELNTTKNRESEKLQQLPLGFTDISDIIN